MRKLFRFILMAVAAIAAAALKAISSLGRLFSGGNYTPPLPIETMTAADVRDEYEDGYEREAAANDARASGLGNAVHQYAAAEDPGVRCAVDLAGLDYQQMDWLLSLGDDDLQKLAAAGPRACELAVTGRRSGIVGLPAPKIEDAAHEVVMHPIRSLLDDRIRRARVRREVPAA
jgi:hypothetical protein